MLDGADWYYYPQPREFAIDYSTKFYTENGLVEDGINSFMGFGADTQISEVQTVVAMGDKAIAVSNMPYSTNSVKGTIYQIDDQTIYLKDIFYFSDTYKRWVQYGTTNVGISVTLNPNGLVLKEGGLATTNQLEVGDSLTAMIHASIPDIVEETGSGNDGANTIINATGYIITVDAY
ncbi:MAG: hypothetical protein ATN35_08085 [Epulopiscium sp. Nele67-Bin004]|nr:MAG: hypothetical protein ATN35_08085 [Epulopiscium sp. Nele67-Bin004]